MHTRCIFHLERVGVCAGASRSVALRGCQSFFPHLSLSLARSLSHKHTQNQICERLNQHSCNNSALIVLLPSLSRLHFIFNQASPPFPLFHLLPFWLLCPLWLLLLALFLPFPPPLFNLALVTVKFIRRLALCSCCQYTRPQISALCSAHTITPSLPSLHTTSLALSPSPHALLCPPSGWPSMRCPQGDVPHPPNNALQPHSYLQPCQHGTGRVNAQRPPGETGPSTSSCLSAGVCIYKNACACGRHTSVHGCVTRSQGIRCCRKGNDTFSNFLWFLTNVASSARCVHLAGHDNNTPSFKNVFITSAGFLLKLMLSVAILWYSISYIIISWRRNYYFHLHFINILTS